MEQSLRKDSEYRPGLPCPLCGRSLLPVPLGTTVVFHCKSGHELPLPDLLAAQSLVLQGGLETLLTEWRRQHQALLETVEDARKHGHLDVAEIFQRRARSLECRIDVLQGAFAKPDSSRLIRLPNSIKPR